MEKDLKLKLTLTTERKSSLTNEQDELLDKYITELMEQHKCNASDECWDAIYDEAYSRMWRETRKPE